MRNAGPKKRPKRPLRKSGQIIADPPSPSALKEPNFAAMTRKQLEAFCKSEWQDWLDKYSGALTAALEEQFGKPKKTS